MSLIEKTIGCMMMAEVRIYTAVLSRFMKIGPHTEIFFPLFFANHRKISIGSGCRIHHNCFLNGRMGGITIGNGVIIQNGVTIVAGQHDYTNPDVPIEKGGPLKEYRPVVIEDDVWISPHVVILPNSHLKKGVLIGAGAVVTPSLETEEYGIYVGNPARFLKSRFGTAQKKGGSKASTTQA